MRRFVRLGLASAVVLAAVALGAPATTAGAGGFPPTKQTITQHDVVSDPDACGGYGVVWDINLTGEIWTFFDDQGRRVTQVGHITEDNTIRNTVTGLTLPDSPVDFVQTNVFDPETGRRESIFVVGTSVNVRRGDERLVDRGPILIDGQTGEILFSAGPHPIRELMDGSFDINLALPGFCDILA
jgi:hypothetical protein